MIYEYTDYVYVDILRGYLKFYSWISLSRQEKKMTIEVAIVHLIISGGHAVSVFFFNQTILSLCEAENLSGTNTITDLLPHILVASDKLLQCCIR